MFERAMLILGNRIHQTRVKTGFHMIPTAFSQCSHQDFALGSPRAPSSEKWGPCENIRGTKLQKTRGTKNLSPHSKLSVT